MPWTKIERDTDFGIVYEERFVDSRGTIHYDARRSYHEIDTDFATYTVPTTVDRNGFILEEGRWDDENYSDRHYSDPHK